MKKMKLPSIENFRDKKISGLKYIIGGNGYEITDGGVTEWSNEDYVADAYFPNSPNKGKVFGMCHTWRTKEEWLQSPEFLEWAGG